MIFILKKKKQEGKKEPYILAETTVVTDRKKKMEISGNYITIILIIVRFILNFRTLLFRSLIAFNDSFNVNKYQQAMFRV